MNKLRIFVFAIVTFCVPAFAMGAQPEEESIKQLLEVTKARKLLDAMMPQMDAMMESSIQAGLQASMKHLTPEQQATIDEMRTRVVARFKEDFTWEKMEPMYIKIYKESFTQEEVDGMLEFYATPAGEALIEKMPVVMQKSMSEMQSMMMPLMQDIQKIQEETFEKLKNQSTN